MANYTKEELYKMNVITIYKMVLKGDIIKTFPKGFWQQLEARKNAAICTKYLIEEILQYDGEMLKEKLSTSMFYKNKLRGMLDICFSSSPYEAINNAYPNKFKQWEFTNVPNKYWNNKENGIEATKWLIEEKLKLNDEQIKEQLSYKLFKNNGLNGMLDICFNSSCYDAINSAYPDRFKEWDFRQVPQGYWSNKKNGIKAAKWLIEEKLKLDDEQVKKQLSVKLFADNGLNGMVKHCFDNCLYKVINETYPGKYKEWELNNAPREYWNNDNAIKATKWLIEEKLKLSDKEVKEQLSQKLFIDNGLGGMLTICFNSSPYNAINTTYPNKFKKWEFKYVPQRYWENKENGIKAIKWLIEEKLKLNDKEIKEQLSQKLFIDNKLNGMLQHCFNYSPYEGINSAYPNKFKPWEFKMVPIGFWDSKDNGIEATKWLIEEKLKLSDEQLKNELSTKLFTENGLRGMLNVCFNGSPYEAINSTYPNKFKEWELRNVPMRYWRNKENAINATRWLIEEKLKLSDKELKEKLSANLFKDNGLSGMLSTCFKNSSYDAINSVYPNKFKKSDFKVYSNNKI